MAAAGVKWFDAGGNCLLAFQVGLTGQACPAWLA